MKTQHTKRKPARQQAAAQPMMAETPAGPFVAWYSAEGLARLDFPKPSRAVSQAPASGRGVPTVVAAWHKATEKALLNILKGKEPGKLPPLDLSAGTAFQQEVWKVTTSVPSGGTISYGRIARAIGRPAATRAVGQACGANPIPVIVPCHRVLAASGRLGGFSGGLDWKRKLLGAEGVHVQS
jgi:O-6-methylguanine DNA methyltransferase